MKHERNQQRKWSEEKVVYPIARPRKIQEHRAHFERKNDQKRAINPVHRSAEFRGIRKASGSADGLLKGSDAFGHAAVIDVHCVDLGETLQSSFRLVRRCLSY